MAKAWARWICLGSALGFRALTTLIRVSRESEGPSSDGLNGSRDRIPPLRSCLTASCCSNRDAFLSGSHCKHWDLRSLRSVRPSRFGDPIRRPIFLQANPLCQVAPVQARPREAGGTHGGVPRTSPHTRLRPVWRHSIDRLADDLPPPGIGTRSDGGLGASRRQHPPRRAEPSESACGSRSRRTRLASR